MNNSSTKSDFLKTLGEHRGALRSSARRIDAMSEASYTLGLDRMSEELATIADNILRSFAALDSAFGAQLSGEHDQAMANVGSVLSAFVSKERAAK